MVIQTANSGDLSVLPKCTTCWWLVDYSQTRDPTNYKREAHNRFGLIEKDRRTDGWWYWIYNPSGYWKNVSIRTICYHGKWFSVENWGYDVRDKKRHWYWIQVKELSQDDVDKLIPEIRDCKKTKEGNCECYFTTSYNYNKETQMSLSEEARKLNEQIKREKQNLNWIVAGGIIIPILFGLVIGIPVSYHFGMIYAAVATIFAIGISSVVYRHFITGKNSQEKIKQYNDRLDHLEDFIKPFKEEVHNKIMGVDQGSMKLGLRMKFDKSKFDVIPTILAEALSRQNELKTQLKISDEDFEHISSFTNMLMDMAIQSTFMSLKSCMTYKNCKEMCDYIKDFVERLEPITSMYPNRLNEEFNLFDELTKFESSDDSDKDDE